MEIYTDASVKKGAAGLGIYAEGTQHRLRIAHRLKNTLAEKMAIIYAIEYYGTEHTYYTDCIISAIQVRKHLDVDIRWVSRGYNKADKVARFARSSTCKTTLEGAEYNTLLKEAERICY